MSNLSTNAVYIVGHAATPVAEHWERTAVSLAHEALAAALGPIDPSRIGALYTASALTPLIGGQSQIAPAVAQVGGLVNAEAVSIEGGGAAGGVAIRQAALAIAAGVYDLVVVLGVEKVSDVLDPTRDAALALMGDPDFEAVHGTTPTAQWAMLMRRYMHEYGCTADDFAAFPVNAHANGAANPGALYRFPITVEKVRAGSPIADPLGLLDCSTTADGAAAIVLASASVAAELGAPLIRIAATAHAADRVALHARQNPLWLAASARSAQQALAAARLSIADIQVLDVMDPHGIAAALALEAIGLAERGSAPAAAREGSIRPNGATPLATAGGCKARGDLIGAHGVYQAVELTRQLRGQAGAAQVKGARVALAQTLGGIGVTAVTTILVAE